MGIFDRFPYSSTHEMNLDFMLGKATEIAESLQEIDTHKEQAEQAATNAAQSAQSAAQAAQAAAGSQTVAGTSASQAAQHKADAEDAADRAEAAWNGADEAAEQAAQAATQAVQTALNSIIGNLSNLTTEDKTNIVSAINAVSNRIITPEMYGAKGDGVTDDTNALRACIQNNAFVLLKGTYLITGVLNFSNINNLTWYGGKITRPANTTFNTIRGSSANNVSLVNITFEGNGNNRETQYTWIDNAQGCIILASQCKNISVKKCKIKNFNYGIFILGADVENAPVSFDNISMNGVICDCVFYNVNSAIDTYGKGLLIEHNMFYECTNNTIQIEPVGDGFATLNPLTDPSFASSAVSITIHDNLFISNNQYDIIIFKNNYSVNICNNTFMNYARGILLNQILSNAIVDGNTFVYQNRTNIVPDANTRPWADAYPTSILCTGEGIIITNNVINNAINGITIKGPCIVKNNTINNPWICGMIMFYANDQFGKAAMITGNKIINHILNTDAWWGSYACVMEAGDAVFTDNVIESDTTPIRAPASSTKMYVSNILTKPAFSGTITSLDYLYPYSNTQA